MNFYNNISEFVVRNVLFSASNYLFNRKKIIRNYRKLTQSEWFSAEALRNIQFLKLKSIIEYSYQWIPYYREKFDEIGFHPQELKDIEDIKLIPPLTRQEVIDYHKRMVDIRFGASITSADQSIRDPGTPIAFARFLKHKLVKNTSSGSTGAPTVFYEDGTRSALNWAHELRLKNWYGIKPGAKEARMVRLSVDYSPSSRVVRLRKALWNQLLLPGTNLSGDDYEICRRAVLEFKPRVLWGFTSALAGLAAYIRDNGIGLTAYRPELVVGWAAPVYDHEEELLKNVFQCPVANIYGAREVGHVAGRCPSGSFHINQENMLVEIEEDTKVSSHEKQGELLVTTLDHSPMPFIRYRMGDIGEVTHARCSCGRSLQVLSNLLGRTGEIFITKSGRMISPNFWCRTFMSGRVSNAVERFQVIYTKSKDLNIKIQKGKKYSQETKNYITETVKTNFSEDTKLTIICVPKIEPQISGKYQMVIKE